jgi:7-cyano-7-deazaguanine synthase in queuosine biosynthesis
MKKVFVLWSGGLDSTFLVEKNLKEGNEVLAGYIELKNNERKTIREKKAMNELSILFRKNYPKFWDYGTIGEYFIRESGINVALKQLPLWITATLYLPRVDEIQIGYTMNDDAISYIPDVISIYAAYQNIMLDKLPPLIFPLIKQKKADTLYTISEEVRKLVTFCESENSDFCGKCHSCERMIDTIRQTNEWYGRDFSVLYEFNKSTQREFDFTSVEAILKA